MAARKEARGSPEGPLRIPGFQLIGKIGEGGMGTVYSAQQEGMDRLVAVKVLLPKLSADARYKERFLREARFSAKLNHVNLINGIDCGEAGGSLYFAMEYVDGPTVKEQQASQGAFAPEEAVRIIRQIAEALAYVSRHGLVHRDIKPDNIMVTSDGVAKLCDLGLAKYEEDADLVTKGVKPKAGLTQPGVTMGTPLYISPEQARGEKTDIRSDLYSLGGTFYCMLADRTPFDDPNPAVIMSQHVQEEAPGVCERNPEVPEAWGQIVAKMMAKQPAHRYQRPEDLIADLDAALAGRTPKAAFFHAPTSSAFPTKGSLARTHLSERRRVLETAQTTELPQASGGRSARGYPVLLPLTGLALLASIVGLVWALRSQAAPAAHREGKPATEAGGDTGKAKAAALPEKPAKAPEAKPAKAPEAKPAVSLPPKTAEEVDREAFDKRYDGVGPNDKAGRIKRLKAYLAAHNDPIFVARARTELDELENPTPPAPPQPPPAKAEDEKTSKAEPGRVILRCAFDQGTQEFNGDEGRVQVVQVPERGGVLLVTPANENPRLGVYHLLKVPEKGTIVEFDVLQRGLERLQVAFQTRKSAEAQTVERHSYHVPAVPENTWQHVRCVVAEATPAQGATGSESAKGLFLQHFEIRGRRKEGSKEPCLMLDNVVVREAP